MKCIKFLEQKCSENYKKSINQPTHPASQPANQPPNDAP